MHLANTGTSDTSDRVLIAANPRAGQGKPSATVERLASVLRHFQFRVDIYTDLDSVTAAAQKAWQAGELRALVAAGGDGTVAELVNRTPVGLPIAVFPLGTCNLLAGYLNILPRFQPFARMLRQGAVVRLDAGQANGRIFLLMVGCGFDAEVVERLHSTRGGHISMWSYAKPILESIRSYQYPEIRVYCDCAPTAAPALPAGQPALAGATAGAAHEGPFTGPGALAADPQAQTAPGGGSLVRLSLPARWVFVVNLPCYAARLQFAPGALGTDGKLEISTFRYGSLLNGFRYLSYLWTSRQSRMSKSDFGRAQARHIRIESDAPVRYQLDGDPGGLLPLSIDVLPKRLTLLAPAERAAALTAGAV